MEIDSVTDLSKQIAYWIAFGAHGPRSVPPPGENWKIFRYTMFGVAVSFALFLMIKSFARPPPVTMTKEWQEASNEYLKVSFLVLYCCSHLSNCYCVKEPIDNLIFHTNRRRRANLSLVYRLKDIAAREWCRVSRKRRNSQLFPCHKLAPMSTPVCIKCTLVFESDIRGGT